MAVAVNHTSAFIVQQAFAEIGWKHGLLTIGSKEQPMELRSQRLSSGSQALGINARPVPAVRLSVPEYWTVPILNNWLHLKGHMSFGRFTDSNWQKDFTAEARQQAIDEGINKHLDRGRYNENLLLHTKAGYLKIENKNIISNFSLELGLEMATQFGGKVHTVNYRGKLETAEAGTGISSFWHAFKPGGQDAKDGQYGNIEGNHLGSWVARLNYENERWGAAMYFDHFFEDQSGMFLLDYDGYGTGENWNVRQDMVLYKFPLKDMILGLEFKLKNGTWIRGAVLEYIYTKYQSGPYNHDRTQNISDHMAGTDDYYNHSFYNSWQHWGQVMGNPLYRSPIYNDNSIIRVENNRFKAFHFGIEGSPVKNLNYRLLASWQEGFGTYRFPYNKPKHNFSTMLEGTYTLKNNWSVTAAYGFDTGEILGDNHGFQLSVRKTISNL